MKKMSICSLLLLATVFSSTAQGLVGAAKKEIRQVQSRLQTNYRWVGVSSGNDIPADAVGGGTDADGSQLIVAHANYQGNWHPGKTRRDWNGANIEYGGQEVSVASYEVLVGGNNLSWAAVSNGNISGNAVIGGQEGDRTLYICRCAYQGSTQLGKTWQGSGSCNIGFGGGGFNIPDFEVLIATQPVAPAQPVAPVQPIAPAQPFAAAPRNNANCLPTSITIASQKSTIQISYDNNGHATGFSQKGADGAIVNFAITTDPQGKILSLVNQGAATGFMLAKGIFVYDQSGRLREDQIFIGAGAAPTATEYYTYNSYGQLIQRKQVSVWSGSNGSQRTSYSYNEYVYPNTATKNPSTVTTFDGNATGKSGNAQQIKILTYDNGKNIGGEFPGAMDSFETFASNNVISADVTFTGTGFKETRTIAYEYNDSGYPISKTYKANGGITFTDNFVYQCDGGSQPAGQPAASPFPRGHHHSAQLTSVTLGSQVWSDKNLDVTTFANGEPIDQAQSNEDWIKAGNEKRAAWCYYNNDPANGQTYGVLYNWFAVADQRGLAPKGWHVPTKYEWITALDFVGGKDGAGYLLKSTTLWQDVSGQNRNGSDANGFHALPAGLRFPEDGKFDAMGMRCQFWTATENNYLAGAIVFLGISNPADIGIANKKFGYSVRCVKD